jgi:hypothetical protein
MRGNRFQSETTKEFLEGYTASTIKALGKLIASNLPTRKAEIISVIQKQVLNTERLRKLWGDLDSLQQAAVAEVVHSQNSHFDAAGFRAKYGKEPDWGTRSYPSTKDKPSLLCLFIYNGQMPRDLKDHLKGFVPPPEAAKVKAADELPTGIKLSWYEYGYNFGKRKKVTEEVPLVRCETESPAQHDLHAILRLIDAGKIRVSEKTKRATAAGAKAITAVLQGGDFYPPEDEPDSHQTEPGPIKAFAWPLILQSAGLASPSGTKLQLTPAGKKAIAKPPHETIRTAWNRWQKATVLDEFNRVNAVKGQTGKGKRKMTALAGRRAAIVNALKACTPNRWLTFDEFCRFTRASGNTFDVTRDLWSLYISSPFYGTLAEGSSDWHIIEGRYIMAFLFEYAATMGLIDVAYIHPAGARDDYRELWGTDDLDYFSRYDGLWYLRINNLGAWCLGLTEAYVPSEPEVSQALKVLPNLEVVATESIAPGDALILEQFAEQTADMVWKIQSSRLLQALEGGYTVGALETFLTTKSGGALPDNVAVFFKDMADRASCLSDCGSARLIEAKDSALAQLIVNDRRLRSLCMLAAEKHIVVPADSEAVFRRTLRKLGYGLPIVQDSSRRRKKK